MDLTDWRETIMCYCAADSFEPEELKARLQDDQDWNDEFRYAFEAALANGGFNPAEWTRDLNFQFRSEQEIAKWLRGIFNFVYFSGSAPNAPSQ